MSFSFIEFFAGGGMARLGLGDVWQCLLANDVDRHKCAAYRANFGGDHLVERDIADVTAENFPAEAADLVWASFPCQDLSLAGARGGIAGERSGTFFSFWRHVEKLIALDKAPRIIAIENVVGLLTSNGGEDFSSVTALLADAGYAVSAMVIDAKHFTPQSRPRIFIFGFCNDALPAATAKPQANEFTPTALLNAYEKMPPRVRSNWRWLYAQPRRRRNVALGDIIDWDSKEWHSADQTAHLISMMSPPQRTRLDALIKNKAQRAGTAFRRTRSANGKTVQRLEARFDGLAGCLRTPAGGSSRQILIAVDKNRVHTRLLSPREAARLMGLPEDYRLPLGATAALKLCGDGVCVPAVRWISEEIFEPALNRARKNSAQAA